MPSTLRPRPTTPTSSAAPEVAGRRRREATAAAAAQRRPAGKLRTEVGGGARRAIGRTLRHGGRRREPGQRRQDQPRSYTWRMTGVLRRTRPTAKNCPSCGCTRRNRTAGSWSGWATRARPRLRSRRSREAGGAATACKAGATVLGADLLFQGEFLKDGEPLTRTRTSPTRENSPATRWATTTRCLPNARTTY